MSFLSTNTVDLVHANDQTNRLDNFLAVQSKQSYGWTVLASIIDLKKKKRKPGNGVLSTRRIGGETR
jgi:hypothetical protein